MQRYNNNSSSSRWLPRMGGLYFDWCCGDVAPLSAAGASFVLLASPPVPNLPATATQRRRQRGAKTGRRSPRPAAVLQTPADGAADAGAGARGQRPERACRRRRWRGRGRWRGRWRTGSKHGRARGQRQRRRWQRRRRQRRQRGARGARGGGRGGARGCRAVRGATGGGGRGPEHPTHWVGTEDCEPAPA